MSSYYDFLNSVFRNRGFSPSSLYGVYRDRYDQSHGAERYLYSKVPIFSAVKKFEDELRNQQDYYEKTGTDPQYIQSLNRIGPGGDDGISGLSNRVSGMARSLSDLYSAEVIEDVQGKFNNAYW